MSRVAARWRRYRDRPRKPRDERSNSFAMFVVLLPVIIGAFGLGVDTARNVYIRISLQNSLDMATVSGAAVTFVNGDGDVEIDQSEALATIRQVYALNRSQGPGLACIGPRTPVSGTDLVQCWKSWNPAVVNRANLTYSVHEQSTNAFLQIVGVRTQDYHLESDARLKQKTE